MDHVYSSAARLDVKKIVQKFFTVILILSFLLLNPLAVAPVQATEVPNPIAPGDMSEITIAEAPPLAIPEFKWSAVSGATSYRLQVSADVAFTTTILNVTTANTSYTPPNATVFPDGTWYWHVRVETPAPIGDYSGIRSFTKTWATPGNLPELLNPMDGGSLDFYDSPTFSWTPVTGAAKYKFQVYSTPGGWSSTVHSATTLVTTYQPKDKLANGVYYWRVVPVDAGNRDGTPSAEQSFTAGYNLLPNLIAPEDNSFPTFTPTFRWTAVRGAQYYNLQYSTDPSFSANVTNIPTRNTAYTPLETLPNDVNYYWRVKVISGSSETDYTPSRSFMKKWYIKPVLLTPTNLYQHVRFPLFSWTPVPGAAYYKIEIDDDPGFGSLYDSDTTANTFYTPNAWTSTPVYYWRVTPYDGSGKKGKESNTASFASYATSVAPHLVYPYYYYPPNSFSGFPGVSTNPYEDRTASLPVFIWHRVYIPSGLPDAGNIYPEAYELQVTDDPTFTSPADWSVVTENTVAAPTAANPFTPLVNTDYFWRVRPIIGGSPAGEWSQEWKTRFDLAKGLTPTATTTTTLIRPTDGFEYAEATPLLEWFPVQTAPSYEVQISADEAFTSIVDSATVTYPAYAPTQSPAQRSLGDTDFGVYYWRVRVTGSGTWSEVRRFQIAAQSQWQLTRTLGDSVNRLTIGTDPASDSADADYDVIDLQAAQDKDYWYIGFHVPVAPTKDLTYALYLDLDHVSASGAAYDARGYTITTIPAYHPEYAIYVLQASGVYSASSVFLYHWNGSAWETVKTLSSIGGDVNHSTDYLEIKVPNTAIGHQDTTGSYTISLFSLTDTISGSALDSVPSDPNVPGSAPVSRFANVTERMNQVMPPNDAGVDPTTFPTILPFYWDWPVLAPWAGANMKAYLDPLFTTEASTYQLTSNSPYYARTYHAWDQDFKGDNTYYWRIQPRYKVGSTYYNGAWSQGWRFERQGFVPQNLITSVSFATPTFSWDMVEGAETYDLQVDDDPAFGSTAISKTTRQTSYTHDTTLANGTYYWRVRIKRNGSVTNNWTPSQTFTISLPIVQNLRTDPAGVQGRAPTFCWDPLVVSDGSQPVMAAWKYRVQVSKEPTFSSIFDNIDTEQSCWTPIKGFDDGSYYWRVAMIDGNGKLGNYSPYATFTKQYPVTALLSPISGSTVNGTPTFKWTPVIGAAKYRLQVSIAENFSSTYDSVDTNNTTYTPTKAYANNTYYWRVAIIDADGKVGPFNTATLILDPYPAAFSKTTPMDGATNMTADPVLTWETSSGANFFEYCIDNSNDDTCAGSWISTGTATSISLSGMNAGTWYWQIRAKNDYGYTYANTGDWWAFTIPVGPAAFSKTAPANNGYTSLLNVTLSWGSTTPVERYEYCIDAVENDICENAWVSTGTQTKAVINLHSGTYYWQVRAVNGITTTYANNGTWWSFSGLNIQPFIDEKLTVSKVTFNWDDVPGATSYKIQVSEKSDFSVLLVNIKTLDSTYFYDTILKNNTTYYWRVRPKFGLVKGVWSATWRFISMDPLAKAVQVAPPDKQILYTDSVTLEWNSVYRAAQYKVVIAKDLAFTTKVASLKTSDLTATFTLPDGKYFWRVRALDPYGAKGAWSAIRSFKVDAVP